MSAESTRPLRIAMWSGPRNISTAMMRAFENRPDCTVSDEPLYAAWLELTGADHPLRDQVIATMDTNWRRVTEALVGPAPDSQPVWYQKHMTHHVLPEMIQRDWLSRLRHVFLIRDPAAVVASYLDKREAVSPEHIGVPQQWALFEFVRDRLGQNPPVIDSGEFLTDPEAHLRALCQYLHIDFVPEMLAWPAGPRDTDGAWAPHWYQRVWESTGFAAPSAAAPALSGEALEVAEVCRPVYQRLYQQRLALN